MVQSETTSGQGRALEGIRVLELGGRVVQHGGRLLADLGADVIKVEPPEGTFARTVGPFVGDERGVERSLYFLGGNANKRSLTLDLTDAEGRTRLLGLVARSDIVLEDFAPSYLDGIGLGFDELRKVNPQIILTSVTGFGQTGPFSRFAFSDLVGGAMGGVMTIQGDPDYPPTNTPLEQGYKLASIHGVMGALNALYNRSAAKDGVHVDVSVQDVASHIQFAIHRYSVEHEITRRLPRGQPSIESYPTKDGWAHIYNRRWEWLINWIDDEVLNDPRWNDRVYRQDNADEAHRIIEEFTKKFTSMELMEQGQKRGIPIAPLSTTQDFANSPHMAERGFWREMEHPVVGTYRSPGSPYAWSETPVQVRRSAPLLGEDTEDVLKLLDTPRRVGSNGGGGGKPPFHGIRILDFTIAFAGPYATRYFAEMGAEVIKVESMKFAGGTSETSGFRAQHPGGRSGNFNEINRSKRSIALDMHFPEAQALALELAKKSDVVIDNFSPGTLAGWNLGYDEIRKVKPDIIMVEMPGFGQTGPYGHFVSLGQTLTAYSGMMRLWGHPGSPESMRSKVAHPDWVGAGHSAVSILAALHHRDQTGQGQYIEVPQVETAATMMEPAFLDYFVNGRAAEPLGNRHWEFAPYNTYPCLGEDRWCAISVETEEQWAALGEALGGPSWAKDERFSTRAGRKAHEDEIDGHLAEWTRERTPHQVMYILQEHGVPAGAVQDAEDLYRDHHMWERGGLVYVDQPYYGDVVNPGLTIRFEGLPETQPKGAPYLGQDNDYVYSELLGLPEKTIKEYTERGFLT